MVPESAIVISEQTRHEEVCGRKPFAHFGFEYSVEACYWCEELESCHDTYSTNDEEYPVICRDCKEERQNA